MAPSGLSRKRDVLSFALLSLRRHRGRTLATIVGAAVGSLVFVLAIGLGQSSQARVSERFDDLRGTTLGASTEPSTDVHPFSTVDEVLPKEGVERLKALGGVEGVARYSVIPQQRIGARSAFLPGLAGTASAEIIGVDGDFWPTAEAQVSGRTVPIAEAFESGVVVSRPILNRLGLDTADASLLVAGEIHPIVGVLESVERLPEAQLAVLMSQTAFDESFSGRSEVESGVVVRTSPGAAPHVGGLAAVALRPDAADKLKVVAPGNVSDLRGRVGGDVGAFAIAAAAVGFVAATFGVANIFLVSVLQRTNEFGLRRALGASAGEVLIQIGAEGSMVGLLGGIVGSVLAAWLVLLWTVALSWPSVFDLSVVAVGVVIGFASAVIGAAVPATIASRVEPAQALRTS